MYLKLGNTNIKYSTTRGNFMVISEVVNSSMGYESPVLVRTTDELDTWFGNEFEEREWLKELLETDSSLSLFLSSPISQTSREFPETEGWINYTKFPIDPNSYYSLDMFPTKGTEGVIYRKLLDPLGEIYEDYIWTEDSYIPVRDLPQNQNPESSISFLQRDTLRIGWVGEESREWSWGYPGMSEIRKDKWEGKKYNLNLEEINIEKIDNGKETLAFSLVLPFDFSSGFYIILGDVVYYTGVSPQVPNSYYSSSVQVTSRENFLTRLKENGWEIETQEEEEEKIIIWKLTPTKVTYFFNWIGLEIEPSFDKTQEMISSCITPVLSFWSKTIGRPREEEWEEDNIHIKIEPVYENKSIIPVRWRATITRYDYMEVHEGTLTPSGLRIDWVIEQNSKLVHASIPDELISSLSELPTGTYQLRGAKPLSWEKQDLQYTLEWMIEGEKNYFPDYVLISNPSGWMTETTASVIYSRWIEMATTGSFQFLIQNNEDNLKWNYTLDKENRLVWFWKGMKVNGNFRPGYYLYLIGLLTDIYSMTSGIILYDIPSQNPYEDTLNTLEELLTDYKSNYLVYNNQMYFYREYQNGVNYETTGWMRFVMGKVTRELYKNMGLYLGAKSVGEVIETIQGILKSILDRFSIIRSLEINSYNVSYKEQKVSLVINTTVSDLRENNMTLDININYNKN